MITSPGDRTPKYRAFLVDRQNCQALAEPAMLPEHGARTLIGRSTTAIES